MGKIYKVSEIEGLKTFTSYTSFQGKSLEEVLHQNKGVNSERRHEPEETEYPAREKWKKISRRVKKIREARITLAEDNLSTLQQVMEKFIQKNKSITMPNM